MGTAKNLNVILVVDSPFQTLLVGFSSNLGASTLAYYSYIDFKKVFKLKLTIRKELIGIIAKSFSNVKHTWKTVIRTELQFNESLNVFGHSSIGHVSHLSFY